MTGDLNYPSAALPNLRFRFCPMCTTPLTQGVVNDDGIGRVLCPTCGWVHFYNNAIAVCTLIHHAQGFVALLPPGVPPETPAALPAGHCEYGESPERAAVREAYEETGLIVEIDGCLGWFFCYLEEYPGPNVAFMFEAHATGGQLRGSDEGRVAVYALDDFPAISPARRCSYRTLQTYRTRLTSAGGEGGR